MGEVSFTISNSWRHLEKLLFNDIKRIKDKHPFNPYVCVVGSQDISRHLIFRWLNFNSAAVNLHFITLTHLAYRLHQVANILNQKYTHKFP
ncbi:MAG: hypothetical protein ACK4OO_07410, partial [bacterium]